MRALAAILVSLTLSACSGEADTSSVPLTEEGLDCAQYADTAERIAGAEDALASGDREAIDDLVSDLDELKQGAPPEVRAALVELEAAFRGAQELLDNPTPENQAALAALAPRLSEAGGKVNAYVGEECT